MSVNECREIVPQMWEQAVNVPAPKRIFYACSDAYTETVDGIQRAANCFAEITGPESPAEISRKIYEYQEHIATPPPKRAKKKCWFQVLIAPINLLNIYSGLFQFNVFLTLSFNIS